MIRRESLKRSIATSAIAGAVVFSFMFAQPVTAQAEGDGEHGHIIPHEIGKLNITGGITSVLQGTSGLANNEDVTDFSYSLDLNFEAAISENAKVVVALEAGNGNGVNDNIPSLSISNYDAYITESGGIVTPSVSQAYYEGSFFDGLLGLKVGKLDVHGCHDENAYANDETDQFITGMFARYAGSIFPELDSYYAPGISLTYSPIKMLDLTVTAANGVDSGFEDITSNAYGAGQVNIKPGFFGREGNYRFYAIYDARNNYRGINDSNKIEENTAYGLSFDQEITDSVGVFVRYAVQDDSIEFWNDDNDDDIEDTTDGDGIPAEDEMSKQVKSAISGGVSINGSLWGRGDDVLGIAVGVLAVNDKASAGVDDNESHFELYYKIGFSEHFTLTPDVQVVTNAGGDADKNTITVYGLRAQMNF